MKDYRTSMDHLSFSPEQKQAMTARLAAATRQKAAPPKARRTRRILAVAVAAALVLSLGTAGATGALRPAGEFFAHLLGGSSAQQAALSMLYGSPYLALVASRIPQYLVNATVCTLISYVIYKSAVTRVATGSFQAG